MHRLVIVLLLGCTPVSRPSVNEPPRTAEPVGAEPLDAEPLGALDANGCGELSYGIHHNPGDDLQDIEARVVGTIPCAVDCDPQPEFATGPIGRNEHGGYGFVGLQPKRCNFEGMNFGIAECFATCDDQDLLGQVHVELRNESVRSRARLCLAFQKRRGPPDVGSCDCLEDDIVWRPSATEAGVSLNFMGTYVLDCGFPPANYLPTRYPD